MKRSRLGVHRKKDVPKVGICVFLTILDMFIT